MKSKITLLLLALFVLFASKSFGQVQFSMTAIGNGKYEVYAKLTQDFPNIIDSWNICVGTVTSSVTTQPTYAFTINPVLNAYYGASYNQIPGVAGKLSNGFTYQSFTENLGVATVHDYPSGSTIDVGTITVTGGSPSTFYVYLLDFSSNGPDGNGNTYLTSDGGTYYYPTNSNASFTTTTGTNGSTQGSTDGSGSGYQYLKANSNTLILPVSLTSFIATKDGSKSDLSWTTATESNNKGFAVERSTDGSNFAQLAFVGSLAANGNSTLPLNYAYTDASPAAGVNYYRLKQTDLDGKATFSNIAPVFFGSGFAVSAMYPNPTASQLNIRLYTPTATNVTYTITDVSGRVISKEIHTANSSTIQSINVSGLAPGAYIITADDGSTKNTNKFTKL